MEWNFPISNLIKVVRFFNGNLVRPRNRNDKRIRLKNGATFTTLVDLITYAPNGAMTSALYGDGYTQTRTYDLSYRLTGLKDALGATKLRDLTYGFEGRDNLTAVTDAITSANSETFTYTPRENLTSATGPYGALAYTYDGVGPRFTVHSVAVTTSTPNLPDHAFDPPAASPTPCGGPMILYPAASPNSASTPRWAKPAKAIEIPMGKPVVPENAFHA
jgi:hypothetical protein